MRKAIQVLTVLFIIQGCHTGETPAPANNSDKQTAETIVDSVFQRDTDSLHELAAPIHSMRYWQGFEMSSGIPENDIYKKLDSINEIFSPFKDKGDTMAKRSIAADYYKTTRDVFEGQEHYSSGNVKDLYDCRAYLQNDTLRILIGAHLGFGDSGLNIWIVRDRFVLMPYSSFCVITDHPCEPLNAPLWQRLVLDKKSYSIGDSLYGYLSFGAVYYDVRRNPSGQKAKGFFRTIIKKGEG
ncbi:hypothetical protein [Niabella beijingensis]|uniref:hypothetical protein n=1 Tax=Niabella beijingensis TaxID=2872700 RepID=UPI001CBDE018|nr:hypothetical protein [Niabella beijingensis]MBZ4188231.1 hypothetical protein [Niabella beijingensis]